MVVNACGLIKSPPSLVVAGGHMPIALGTDSGTLPMWHCASPTLCPSKYECAGTEGNDICTATVKPMGLAGLMPGTKYAFEQ